MNSNRRLVAAAVTLAFLAPGVASAATKATQAEAWSLLKSGRYVVLIRHAVTDPGVGDPPSFKLGDCSTQRNLSTKGRADAQRIGDAFRQRQIPIAGVYTSRWCRCVDTANLAFGKATPAPMLDSMFNDDERKIEGKVREVRAAVLKKPESGNLIYVTHDANIRALVGESVTSGEMVVAEPNADGSLQVVGRIPPD